jgi:hypothetical protein
MSSKSLSLCLLTVLCWVSMSPKSLPQKLAGAISQCQPDLAIFEKNARTSKWGAIGRLQSKLLVSVDGKYGPITDLAIRRWQKQKQRPKMMSCVLTNIFRRCAASSFFRESSSGRSILP